MAEPQPSPFDLCPSVPDDATPEDCIRAWIDLMATCEAFLLAALRREVGPDGDIQEAYRRWYAQQMEEHDKMMPHLMESFHKHENLHAS